jgi:hypothetical protein
MLLRQSNTSWILFLQAAPKRENEYVIGYTHLETGCGSFFGGNEKGHPRICTNARMRYLVICALVAPYSWTDAFSRNFEPQP